MPIYKQGADGSKVKQIQNQLKELGYYKGTVDGIFGPGTEGAVKAFQQEGGLTVDGIVGPNTWENLFVDEEEQNSVDFPGGAVLQIIRGYPDTYKDPLNTGNPLFDTSEAQRNKQLSDNFRVGEFAQSGDNKFDMARIDPDLVKLLQEIRNDVGGAVTINSGYRPPWYNDQIGGANNSQHMGGRAADIRASRFTGPELARIALTKNCNIGLGVGANYIHVDVRGKWARWTYDPGPELNWVDQLYSEICR